MNLFHANYDKPGPGIGKDEPKKNSFVRFFSILSRKFFQFVELNLLFGVFAATSLVIAYYSKKMVPDYLPGLLSILFLSPFCAGITFITRNYAREEHAFLVSDFFDAVRKNWKMFLMNGAVCYFLYFILNISIRFYAGQQSYIYKIALGLCVTLVLLLLFSQYYVPLMIVTFDLKLIQIYKNALIFSVLGLWRNLLLTVLLAVLGFGLFLFSQIFPLALMIAILFVATLLFSISSFLINFIIYPLVDQTMIQKSKIN